MCSSVSLPFVFRPPATYPVQTSVHPVFRRILRNVTYKPPMRAAQDAEARDGMRSRHSAYFCPRRLLFFGMYASACFSPEGLHLSGKEAAAPAI